MRERERLTINLGGETRTKRAMQDDCNINLIVKRHAQTGMWDHLNPHAPTYGDFTASVDLQEAINLATSAQDEFDALPASVRAVVDNDPVRFSEALSSPDLFRELVEAGMPATEEPEPAPDVGPETPEEPPTSTPT